MCMQGVCARVRSCVHGRRRVLTLNVCVCTLAQKPPLPRMTLQTRHNRPWAYLLFHQALSSLFAPTQPELYLILQKINIMCTAFCFTSATVYLPGSRSLLFLHVPDIIIAVRGMIICLLWKLADCLSPVPEELPLKGIPLEKHHKKWLLPCSSTDRMIQDGEEDTANKGGRESGGALLPFCYNIYLNWSIHHTCFSASSVEWAGQQEAEKGRNGGLSSHKMNAL